MDDNKRNMPVTKRDGAYYLGQKKLWGLSRADDTTYIKSVVDEYNKTLSNADLETVLFLDGFERATRFGSVEELAKQRDLSKEDKKSFYNQNNRQKRDVYNKFKKEEIPEGKKEE